MIQFKRGSSRAEEDGKIVNNWDGVTLADGQPCYDKTTNRLKVGDGKSKWSKLKSIGLSKEQIIESEEIAKIRLSQVPQDPEDFTIFTYGSADPGDEIVGQVYLQQYNGKVESDYIIAYGYSNNATNRWYYRKSNSNYVECFCTFKVPQTNTASDSTKLGNLYTTKAINIVYPFEFEEVLFESASLVTNDMNTIAWLATSGKNTLKETAYYSVVSAVALKNTDFYITVKVQGILKTKED